MNKRIHIIQIQSATQANDIKLSNIANISHTPRTYRPSSRTPRVDNDQAVKGEHGKRCCTIM